MKNTFSKYSIFIVLFFSYLNVLGQNTLPSCVITMPHTNAYFKENTEVKIRVYASDLGGSFSGGSISKVEFFKDDEKLGEATTAFSNTYIFSLQNVEAGTYRLTAKATDNNNAVSISAGVIINVGPSDVEPFGLSANKGKYLGNIIPDGGAQKDYNIYWNGVTAENSCKWGSVEGVRDVMQWGNADKAYNHAKNNYMMYRYHLLAWGSQYPKWIETLSPAEFQEEMEEYMAAVAERYPLIDQFDVLNENMYRNTYNKEEHAAGTPFFRAGLGGPGDTGYDWAIWLFEKARQYFPNSKLVINDFEMVSNSAGRNEILDLVKVLRDRGLIDGIGAQAHYFNVDGLAASSLQNALNSMATSGVPIYITELDIKGNPVTETNQLNIYKKLFPIFWEHPAVAGITLWGYIEGSTWSPGTGILNRDESEREAMTWLKNYMINLPDAGYPFGVDSEDGTKLRIQAEDFEGQSGLTVVPCSEGGSALSSISNNDYSYYSVDLAGGYTTFEARVAGSFSVGRPQGTIQIRSGSVDGPTLGTIELLGTGGLETWQTFSCPLTGATGVQNLYLVFKLGGYQLNWLQFKDMATSIETPSETSDYHIYPNPITSGKVWIESNSNWTDIEILNMQGKVVKSVDLSSKNKSEVDVSSLKKGAYILRMHSEYSVVNKKITIQ